MVPFSVGTHYANSGAGRLILAGHYAFKNFVLETRVFFLSFFLVVKLCEWWMSEDDDTSTKLGGFEKSNMSFILSMIQNLIMFFKGEALKAHDLVLWLISRLFCQFFQLKPTWSCFLSHNYFSSNYSKLKCFSNLNIDNILKVKIHCHKAKNWRGSPVVLSM
jgi:hypothetical protein